ncbi:Receptor homology region transmembrane domain- and RING domain-containing protein 2 [Zea mays]|uniref:Receptor homology region transmembrane domain-and RING domain-containing protein 2 n=1 Tax=Zea mays TaxID=4577 RepID=A0A1D6PXH6_MAIZE|nr:Receptor homology region transmembrane domain- and RING domain-containing protein 2 [Zea mays]AQK51215.1 Receptor homology region transmembrane domain- and RING domain-containing protein 2 [Zea mays]
MACPRGRTPFPLCFFLMICLMAQLGASNVVLMANNTTLSLDDVEATFTPAVEGSGVSGVLYAVEPKDACSPLRAKAIQGSVSPFALIIRGGCQFDDKIRNAQNAGFKAAVVYNNEDNDILVSMAGSSLGVQIYAVFISKASGEELKKYSGQTDAELWIIPTYENSAWPIMAISFVSLLAMSAILVACFFARRHQIRRDRARLPRAQESHGMSSQLVKAIPSLIFTKVQEDNCTSATCAICLEDYSVGEKIRVLPCRHSSSILRTPDSRFDANSSICTSGSNLDLANVPSPCRYVGSSRMSHGSSGQQHPHLRHCTLSGPSLFTMVPQSPQQNQLQHGGYSETNLSAAASAQSFRQLYLQHCPDSDTSSQSLPGC